MASIKRLHQASIELIKALTATPKPAEAELFNPSLTQHTWHGKKIKNKTQTEFRLTAVNAFTCVSSKVLEFSETQNPVFSTDFHFTSKQNRPKVCLRDVSGEEAVDQVSTQRIFL